MSDSTSRRYAGNRKAGRSRWLLPGDTPPHVRTQSTVPSQADQGSNDIALDFTRAGIKLGANRVAQ
ncbi:MAG TPA: hypothetical protein VFJ88_03290, partial [Chthoniobacterales bacterium]|nr:hypothetical protein [Chthoniobacterales bacterium]